MNSPNALPEVVIYSSPELSSPSEAGALLSLLNTKRELFVTLQWQQNMDRQVIALLQIGERTMCSTDKWNLAIWTIPGEIAAGQINKLKQLLQNRSCLKVMFNPRGDYTKLLHYGIQMRGLFDVQSFVQCATSNTSTMAHPMTPEQICERFKITYTTNELPCIVNMFTFLKRKKGEWCMASKRTKYIYRRKISRILRLTENQKALLNQRR